MKQTKLFLTTIAVLLCSVMANAHDFEVDGIYYNILSDTTVEVTYRGSEYDLYDEYSGSVTIPSSVTHNTNIYSVTSIGESAFQQCSNLSTVIIGDNVEIIKLRAFEGCSNLNSVDIPNKVKTIEYDSFASCSSLTSITIPNAVKNIYSEAFSYCSSLVSIHIPNSVNFIGSGAFSYCPNLTSITVESGNSTYDSRNGCNAIIEKRTNVLIQGCNNSVIPNGITRIESHAFAGCSNLASASIPNSVTSIGFGAFNGCSNLASVTIPNSVTSIEDYAFGYCFSLMSVILPNNLTSIEDDTFLYCTSLTSVNIPNSVQHIGTFAFGHCSSLTSATIPEGVDIIKAGTFYNCSSLASICIPNSIIKIGRDAFCYCSSLTSITIPNSVISIEDSAFGYCSSLTSVILSNNLTSIGYEVFISCTNLTSIIIPNSVMSIGDYAFCQCSGLTSIEIPNNVTNIGAWCFDNCTSLTSIIIPQGITIIKEGTFYHCSGIDSIAIPNGVTSIGDRAFEQCDNLVSISIPNSVTSIGKTAVSHCDNLTSITIPNSVTSIGESAFANCMSLDTVIVEATTPPSTENDPFHYPRPTCYVPCGTVDAYKASDWNTYCEAIIEPASEIQFNISVSDSTQGCIIIDQQPTCSNDTLIFHAEPIPSHYFVQWSDGNTDNPRTIILTQDTALAAEFAIKTCTLELSAEGNGTVTGAGTYNYGDTAIITARPDEHHHFVQWSDGNTDTLRTIVLTQDTTLTARFAIDTYTLYLYAGSNGIVTGAGTYDYGDTVIITATPNDGYYFTQWSDGNTDNPRTIIVTEDVFLSANFIIGGQCGDSLYWTYEQSTKQLTLLGTGDMYDYTVWTLPWQKCTHMIRSISLPEGMTTIGTSACADCKYVQSIVIPSSVERIYDSAFENCRMLSELQFSKDGVLSELGSWAFYNCHELKELAIPEGVTSIGYATFYGCTYLNELTLPATMEYIADNGFAYCAKLQKMTVNAITPPQVDARTFEDVDRSIPVYVPDESVNVYRSAPVWQEFNIQGKSGVPSNVDNVEASTCEVQKILRNGQLIITRDGVEYNAVGQKM